MPDYIQVGYMKGGLVTNPLAFNINNDAFPTLINAYQWRGRLKRKRGTVLVGRLERFFNSNNVSYTPGGSVPYTFTLTAGAGNVLTATYSNGTAAFNFKLNVISNVFGSIVPGTVTIVDVTTSTTYTDNSVGGLVGGAGGTINYETGAFTLTGAGNDTVYASFFYYPDLPVLGLEDLTLPNFQFPGEIAFDTTYSYNIVTSYPYNIYDVSFYKNPVGASINGHAYTAKTSVTPTSWNGFNYQQFWSANYEGALWVTNGVGNPFNASKIGMQFAPASSISGTTRTNATTMTFTVANCPLVVGDWVFVNEFTAMGGAANAATLNLQTGFVTVAAGTYASLTITVVFPYATIAADTYTPGIIQYLTNRSDRTIDCIRWYDGDPTTGSAPYTTLTGGKGWVNFMPPLSIASYGIGGLPASTNPYYLVGARMIIPFKDRLVVFGPVVQTSTGSAQYLGDTVLWSEVGTPYYTASFTGSPTSATTTFNALLVPDNQTAVPIAYAEDVTGFGGYKSAGLAQQIITSVQNEDVIILGFTNRQVRMVYSGDDLDPFDLFTINSEFGSLSTFSAITLDRGGFTISNKGIIETQQVASARIDLDIPDQVFQFNLDFNGSERITAQRDFINEWIYFSYLDNESAWRYNNQTLQYNYRDNSWAIFNESYTTYGQFRRVTGQTWATIGNTYPTWASWNEPWNAGSSSQHQPEVIAGDQQGFVLLRDQSTTNEGFSLYIQSISGSTITSPDHGLNEKDFILINNAIGTVSQQINNKIFQVGNTTQNTFNISPPITGSPTYFGEGVIKRFYVPFIQTKQFPMAWGMARKTRIGSQQYLFTTTDAGQIELQIYLSQNAEFPYNFGPIVPAVNSINNSLIYTDTLFTCPESTNLGLTPYNVNLNLITSNDQEQTWHRMNTSLLGDTIQIGFTVSDAQMFTYTAGSQSFNITAATNAYPCVLTCANSLAAGQLVQITGVMGMTQLNFNPMSNNYYNVLSANSTSVTIDIDSTAFGVYVSGGTIVPQGLVIQTSEIELHGFILAVSPSQVLA